MLNTSAHQASCRFVILHPWIWLALCPYSSGPDFSIRTSCTERLPLHEIILHRGELIHQEFPLQNLKRSSPTIVLAKLRQWIWKDKIQWNLRLWSFKKAGIHSLYQKIKLLSRDCSLPCIVCRCLCIFLRFSRHIEVICISPIFRLHLWVEMPRL